MMISEYPLPILSLPEGFSAWAKKVTSQLLNGYWRDLSCSGCGQKEVRIMARCLSLSCGLNDDLFWDHIAMGQN